MPSGAQKKEFEPAWWLPGGHIQTLYRKFSPIVTVRQVRQRIELKDGDFIDSFKINTLGAINAVKINLSSLINNNGSVLFFSTIAVQQGFINHSIVASSKGAIEGLTLSLAAEFAPKIRVNVIAPSIVNTPLANRFLNNEIKVQKSSEKHPLNRIGNKDDISEMINFLLSEKSTWITGQIISVDGGLSTIIKN